MLKIIILVLSVLCLSYGQIIQNGTCENLTVFPLPLLNGLVGTWFEIARTENPYQDKDCPSVIFAPDAIDDGDAVNGTIIYETVTNNFVESISGSVKQTAPGQFQFTLPFIQDPIDFFVSRSDISSYTIGCSCINIGETQRELYVWVLGRNFDNGTLETVERYLNSDFEISFDDLETVDRTRNKCFRLPEIDEGNPIVISGSCDSSELNVVQNFDSAKFTGRWFDIENYYDPSQPGTCNDVSYRSREGFLEIESTQVNNERLNTTTVQATLASDGSGRLIVTTSEDDVTVSTEFLILATDYESYALVYSCQDKEKNQELDPDTRQIRSWKLSRSRQLSTAAATAINTVINNHYVLNDRFYQANDHSEQVCFYYPEPIPGQAVVFRGQCDENISGVENFDLEKFLGWWHEIEHYPSDRLVGDCISSRFESSGNQYLVLDTNIFDLKAVTNTSTLQVTDDGKLIKTLDNDTIEIQVLAVDYEDYAFLYSCKNIDSEHRHVWSAKHSKTRQLSQAAQNAFAPIIESIQVLDPEYYFQVDQSDNGCFHYPEQTGDLVILPGQCDTNIPVVQNFEFSEYSGIWYDIERYRRPGQGETCIGTKYNFNDQNDLGVITWYSDEDGFLNTVEGSVTSESNGRLTVILSVPDSNNTLTTELYVLATDYESYALTYTCANVDEYHRAVGAWKLSRTRTLPSTATNAINAVMNQRQELHQPYFMRVFQGGTCEDPNGAFVLNSSIILVLLCAIINFYFY